MGVCWYCANKDLFCEKCRSFRKQAQPLLNQIKAATAVHYGISVADLVGGSRKRNVCYPRHLAMFIASKLMGRSSSEIGLAFGGRDHTTVLNALRSVEARMERDQTGELRGDMKKIIAGAQSLWAYEKWRRFSNFTP